MDELNVLGSSLTQESQLRVINSFTRKASKDGSEVPKPPRPTLNTEYLNELVRPHFYSLHAHLHRPGPAALRVGEPPAGGQAAVTLR